MIEKRNKNGCDKKSDAISSVMRIILVGIIVSKLMVSKGNGNCIGITIRKK